MKESEIRSILARLCAELDARSARVAGAAVVGSSLALAAGCGGEAVTRGPDVDAGIAEASTDAQGDTGAEDATPNDATIDQGPLPPYMAPDTGPTPEYMAVDAADDGPTPVYMSACAPVVDEDPVV